MLGGFAVGGCFAVDKRIAAAILLRGKTTVGIMIERRVNFGIQIQVIRKAETDKGFEKVDGRRKVGNNAVFRDGVDDAVLVALDVGFG